MMYGQFYMNKGIFFIIIFHYLDIINRLIDGSWVDRYIYNLTRMSGKCVFER